MLWIVTRSDGLIKDLDSARLGHWPAHRNRGAATRSDSNMSATPD